MKVHLNQIPEEGLHVEGVEDSKMLGLQEESLLQPVSDVRYSLDVGLSDGGLFATGTIAVDVECQCVSCLERFRQSIGIPDFACQIDLPGRELVDLTEPVREDILLALPPHPHCDWNGERTCPGPPAPKPAPETEQAPATDEDSKDVWGALDQLKLK
jgi:uncharacterized metal-binding protein YceD (DUF177 family)